LDRCRTTLNVVGDLVAAAFVARGESDVDLGPTLDSDAA